MMDRTVFQLRASPTFLDSLRVAAEASGESMSDYVRRVVEEAISRGKEEE
jgi:predicted HicB family RNase H-like nuclease